MSSMMVSKYIMSINIALLVYLAVSWHIVRLEYYY